MPQARGDLHDFRVSTGKIVFLSPFFADLISDRPQIHTPQIHTLLLELISQIYQLLGKN
jgi:hypothetical protein